MKISLWILSLTVAIGLASLTARCLGQTESSSQSPARVDPTSAKSVARFAIDDFVVGCRVQPKPLFADSFFGSLPIHPHFPEPVSLRRLNALGVEELAVFCGPASGEKRNAEGKDGTEWAAAARLAEPIELKAVMRQWRHSLVPQEESGDPNPESIRIGGFDCFRVPAGSFFAPPRIYGKLRFTGRDGQPADQGINVGNIYEYRSYVEGNTKASAIFTLDDLDENDLVDGQLPLELRLDVFLTSHSGREFTIAQVELRNPDTGLRSEPVRIEAKSYVNRRLNFPHRLTAIDEKGKRQAELLEDFVSKGRLEVILKGTEEASYTGVGAHDLNLRPRAFEYVYLSDREIVIAQSQSTFAKMLRAPASPAALADRLSQSGEIVIAVNAREGEDRKALEQLARLISDGPIVRHWGGALTELTGIVRLDQPATARITVKFTDRLSSEKADRLCQAKIRELRLQAREIIDDRINRVEAMANLATLGMDGISFAFPRETAEAYQVEHEKRIAELLKIIDSALNSIRVESKDDALTIQFAPPTSLSSLSKPAKYAWAKMDESLGRFLYNAEKFDLADEVFQQMTNRLPEEPGAWFRRAWHLSYNMPPQFDGYKARYAWVRRGINVLLDGAEQNPGTMDLLWMAARFISRKIGEADDRAAFRELFSRDKELQNRLAKYIDLDKAKSPDAEIDNFLVAKLLFEHCIERHTNEGATMTFSPVLFFSRPAVTQARYAESLGRSGESNAAQRAWKEAERLHKELGARTIDMGDGIRIRLNDWKARQDKFGPTDPFAKALDELRKSIRYDFWLTRCRFEQRDEVQSARKLSYEAAELAKQSEWKKASEQYRRSLQILADLSKRHPEEMSLLGADFSDIASGYRKSQKQLSETDEELLIPILELIETSHPFSTFPLTLDPEAYLKQ